MANPEHLEKLRQGIKAWNEWRTAEPGVTPDLGEAFADEKAWLEQFAFTPQGRDFRGINLAGADARGAELGAADFVGANLQGASFSGANLYGSTLSAADLRRTDFQEAKLGEVDLREANLEGIKLRGADLRKSNLPGANLQGVDLGGINLEEALLAGANLEGTRLVRTDFQKADLQNANLKHAHGPRAKFCEAELVGADLREADLRQASFLKANLEGAKFRQADLRGADLSDVRGGLRPDQLAGADLTNAKLPDALGDLLKDLKAVGDISESARKLFIAMLVACLYSWLTIATTSDVNLITNRASSPLPIIQSSIPIVGFYVVAPLLLLCVYFYFHFYLQKLWEELGSLPAVFPDGRRLHERSDPWLLNDLVRAHVEKLKADRPFMSYFQQGVSIVLAWWLVPITVFFFWGRYLPRHDYFWTTLQVALLTTAIVGAVALYYLAASTLKGAERRSFSRTALKKPRTYAAFGSFIAVGAAFMLPSAGAIGGVPPSEQFSWWGNGPPGRWGWVPRIMALVHYSPFANLGYTKFSTTPANWTRGELKDVQGADFHGADLRYANLSSAFLAKANLEGARLEGATLSLCDLREADLRDAHLSRADLSAADMTGA